MFAPARRSRTLAMTARLTVVVGLIAAPSASASHEVQPARVSGDTRAATAANVASLAYADGTDVAFIARDDGFADALASAALAGFKDAPKAPQTESTDTDAAVITFATGTDDPGEKGKRDAHPNDDEVIEFGVASDANDCAVPTVFADRNDNSALDLDADDHPVEPYGVGKISWN